MVSACSNAPDRVSSAGKALGRRTPWSAAAATAGRDGTRRIRTNIRREMSAITVTGLNVYPFKSCAGMDLEEARITPRGFEHDRRVHARRRRRRLRLAAKGPRARAGTPTLGEACFTLAAPGMPDVEVPLQLEPRRRRGWWRRPSTASPSRARSSARSSTTGSPRSCHATSEHRRFRLLRVREDRPRYYQRTLPAVPRRPTSVGFADGNRAAAGHRAVPGAAEHGAGGAGPDEPLSPQHRRRRGRAGAV